MLDNAAAPELSESAVSMLLGQGSTMKRNSGMWDWAYGGKRGEEKKGSRYKRQTGIRDRISQEKGYTT